MSNIDLSTIFLGTSGNGCYSGKSLEALTDIASNTGRTVIQRGSDEILLDIDRTDYPTDEDKSRLKILKNIIPLKSVVYWKSRSGNTHVKITTAVRITDMEAIAISSLLGSDPMHCFISLEDCILHTGNPISVLFKPNTSEEMSIDVKNL